jgi:hypothetical protein
LIAKRITDQLSAFLSFELANNADSRRQKVALQELSRLYRTGHILAPETAVQIEQQVVGLTSMSRDQKVVRWCLNTLARIGTKDSAASIEQAIVRYEAEPEIVAAAVSALARLRMGKLSDITALRGVLPEVQMLAAMQTVSPAQLDAGGLQIDIATADPEILKLALIIVGLDRDVQNLLHPRHDNGVIVRELGQHDDPIVRQYGVWAVIENHRLTLDHLGIDLDRVEEQPENVQSKLLQLGASTIPDFSKRHDLVMKGADLSSIDAREGLAKGLLHTYYDALETVTLAWFDTDGNERIRLLLAEHFARHSDMVPSYHDKAMELAEGGGPLRERVLLGAYGTALYGTIKQADGQAAMGLFGLEVDQHAAKLEQSVQAFRKEAVLVLNAAPADQDYIRPEREVAWVERQLEAVKNPQRYFDFVPKFAVRVKDIQKELLNNSPKIMHFSGHGYKGGLFFEDDQGFKAHLDANALADFIRVYGRLECLVLHACYSEDVARACAKHVKFVVGSTGEISDDAAECFSPSFYQALANGRPYANAFQAGRAEVRTVSEQDAEYYKLFTR